MQIARGLQIGHVVGWPQGPPSKGPPPNRRKEGIGNKRERGGPDSPDSTTARGFRSPNDRGARTPGASDDELAVHYCPVIESNFPRAAHPGEVLRCSGSERGKRLIIIIPPI
jgi:hypothetical protein